MNKTSLILKNTKYLKSNKNIPLNTPTTTSSTSLNIIKLIKKYNQLTKTKQIQLTSKPQPFNYHLINKNPNQKQSHLPTKITTTIKFQIKLNTHTYIQKKTKKNNITNKTKKKNSILNQTTTINSSISNNTFKTNKKYLKKLKNNLQKKSINTNKITKITNITTSLKNKFITKINI